MRMILPLLLLVEFWINYSWIRYFLSDISQLFMNNNLKSNAGKFHFFHGPYEDQMITVWNYVIKLSSIEELLVVTKYSNLNFKEHILPFCKKSNSKLHALSRVSKYITLNKRCILVKSFIISQFNLCPLICMIHNRGLNIKINHKHTERLRDRQTDRQRERKRERQRETETERDTERQRVVLYVR